MRHALAVTMLAAVALTACGKEEAPPQQTPASPPAPQAAAPQQQAPTPPPASVPATPAISATAAEMAAAPRLYTVQVAAYMNAASAQALRTRLERQNVPVWTTTARIGGQDFTRVRVGVATSTADARALATKLRNEFKWPVWITTVADRNSLPAEVLAASRTYAARN
jgi:cell division septation protein DedD